MIIVLYLATTLENGYFKASHTWVGMFLKHVICFSARFYFLWAVDVQKQERRRRIWRIGGILKKITKPLPRCIMNKSNFWHAFY